MDNTEKLGFEEFLKHYIGEFSKWHCTILFVLLFPSTAPYASVIAFNQIIPPHRCKIPETESLTNRTYSEITRLTIPLKANPEDPPMIGQGYHPCLRQRFWNKSILFINNSIHEMFNPQNETTTENCLNGMAYDTSNYEYAGTVVQEFDLVCERAYLAPLSTTFFMVGTGIACLFTGYLSDMYGRTLIMKIVGSIQFIMGIILIFTPNVYIFIMVQLVLGFCFMALFLTVVVYLQEISTFKTRAMVMALEMIVLNSIAPSILAGVAYLLPNWRHVATVIFIFNLPVIAFFGLPESPRWLLVKGRRHAAIEVLKKARKQTNAKHAENDSVFDRLIDFECLQIENSNKDSKFLTVKPTQHHGVMQFLKTFLVPFNEPTLRVRSTLIAVIWFIFGLVIYGVMFLSVKLKGNIYLVFFILNGLTIVSIYAAYLLLDRLGRRKVLFLSTLCNIPLFLSVALIQIYVPQTHSHIVIGLLMAGKLLADMGFTSIYTYTPELFPTEIRNYALGLSSAFARIGSTSAPFVIRLGETHWRPIPMIIFTALFLLCLAVSWRLPETLGCPLPDYVAEMGKKADQSHIKPSPLNDLISDEIETNGENGLNSKLNKNENSVT